MFVASTNFPAPFIYVTLFFLKSPSIPFVSEVTIPYLFFWVWAQLTLVFPTSIPIALKS